MKIPIHTLIAIHVTAFGIEFIGCSYSELHTTPWIDFIVVIVRGLFKKC